jgi:hypothetical protein
MTVICVRWLSLGVSGFIHSKAKLNCVVFGKRKMVPSTDCVATDVEKDTILDAASDVYRWDGCCAWYQFRGETSAKGYCTVRFSDRRYRIIVIPQVFLFCDALRRNYHSGVTFDVNYCELFQYIEREGIRLLA